MWLLLIVVWLLPYAIADAGHITIQVDTRTQVAADLVLCSITMVNRGDEAAADVQAHVELAGRQVVSPLLPQLPAAATKSWTARLDGSGLGQGRHPILIKIHYADANGYPFTALAHAVCVRGSDLEPGLEAGADELALGTKGKARLTLVNPMEAAYSVRVTLALPRELSTTTASRELEIGAQGRERVHFDIENVSALAGSAYQALAFVSYRDKGLETFEVVKVPIRVVGSTGFVKQYRLVLLIALAVLVGLFLGAQLRRRPSSRSPR